MTVMQEFLQKNFSERMMIHDRQDNQLLVTTQQEKQLMEMQYKLKNELMKALQKNFEERMIMQNEFEKQIIVIQNMFLEIKKELLKRNHHSPKHL